MVKEGATVQVVMTEAAAQFITPVTMQALSGRPVFDSQWDRRPDNNMAHIQLSREADAVLIAPASSAAARAQSTGASVAQPSSAACKVGAISGTRTA
jgi:phosphopantothenoylcysteine decarboxylase/phosphopantothenate--cysteine ligase